MTNDYIICNGELYHYGVKGMKWGHRKKYYNNDGSMNKLGAARQNLKTANKAYSKSFNKAYNYSYFHPISQHVSKKAKAKSNANWDDTFDKAGQLTKARAEYKKEKNIYKDKYKQAKQEYRSERKDVSKSRSMGAKVATNILAGAFANRTYNSVIAAGGSRTKARVITGVTGMIGGPLGHLAVSSLYTAHNAEKRVQ